MKHGLLTFAILCWANLGMVWAAAVGIVPVPVALTFVALVVVLGLVLLAHRTR